MTATGRLCTATAGDARVGIATTDVREVVRDRNVTPIPLAGAAVRGIMNLRGDLVTVIDLRVRLGQSPHPDPQHATHVVLRGDPARSLLVDAVGEIIDADARVTVPANIDAAVGDLIDGAIALSGDLLLVLATERVASLSEALADGSQTIHEEH